MSVKTFADLSPTEFENFSFDLIQAAGMRQIVWRTPGADGGRDMEALTTQVDRSGYLLQQKWYVECKRYSTSIDWPTVWNKLSYADADEADFLLLITNSNPSPACESKISEWNNQRRLTRIRVWRGYELHDLLLKFPVVGVKYGLISSSTDVVLRFLELSSELMKLIQTAYVSSSLNQNGNLSLEASAALSELLELRLQQIGIFGKFVETAPSPVSLYPWVRSNVVVEANDVAIRAILSLYRYVVKAEVVEINTANARDLTVTPDESAVSLTESAIHLLKLVATWGDLEIESSGNSLVLSLRK